MRGVVGFSLWNIGIMGIVAVVAVSVYNHFAAGKTVPFLNMTLGRA